MGECITTEGSDISFVGLITRGKVNVYCKKDANGDPPVLAPTNTDPTKVDIMRFGFVKHWKQQNDDNQNRILNY